MSFSSLVVNVYHLSTWCSVEITWSCSVFQYLVFHLVQILQGSGQGCGRSLGSAQGKLPDRLGPQLAPSPSTLVGGQHTPFHTRETFASPHLTKSHLHGEGREGPLVPALLLSQIGPPLAQLNLRVVLSSLSPAFRQPPPRDLSPDEEVGGVGRIECPPTPTRIH